ncbi:MAG: hypothetical protein B9S32_09905 [Verrucomicrobia bacterium Tous-C9LFEB]|nr:MAG: hypothetical protein B9S32_09905 [Verrucomicrobia bacterium Tous-C9LFEB]
MKKSSKITVLLGCLALLGGVNAFSQVWTAAGSGAWTTDANWSTGVAPVSSNVSIVSIDDALAAASQTVTLDISGINYNVGSFTLSNSAGAGFTNTLLLTSSGTAIGTSIFNVNGALSLGSPSGTVEIRLSPSVNAGFSQLSATGGITVNSGGLITLDGTTGTTVNANVKSPVTLSGGTMSVLGGSASGGVGQALTMTSGVITFDKNAASTAGRLTIGGDFNATGGAITANHFSGSANIIELYGANNTLSAVTINNSANLSFSFRGTTNQSLTSSVDLPSLILRNGKINTVTLTSAAQNTGSISFLNSPTTLKLGSDMNTIATPTISAVAAAGSGIDANGHTFNVTAGTQWNLANNMNLTSSAAGGRFKANSYAFGNGTIGSNIIVEATGGGGATNTLDTATFNPTSTLLFSGNATTTSPVVLRVSGTTQTVGNLQVGTGTSATSVAIQSNNLVMAGNLSVLSNSTLDLNGRAHTLSGSLQGNGMVRVGANANLVFNSTGGISPGFGGAGIGAGYVGGLSLVGTATSGKVLTLNSASVSFFDLSSDVSYDSVSAGGFNLTLDGQLVINLIDGYTPMTMGQTWTIFTGLGSGTTGNFSSILSNSGETFSFAINGSGNGILTLTSIPEPSTWILLLFSVLILGRGLLRSRWSAL